MSLRAALSIPLLASAGLAAADPVAAVGSPWQLAQLTIHERVVVRVRQMPISPPRPVAPVITWKEKGGPKCLAVNDMAGALTTQPDAVDIVLIGGQRVRAKLDGDCRPLDFYSGFYLKPSADGKICSRRDAIRVRSGASCPIAKFRSLKPEPAKR